MLQVRTIAQSWKTLVGVVALLFLSCGTLLASKIEKRNPLLPSKAQTISSPNEFSIQVPDKAELRDFIRMVSEWTGKNVILDSKVNGKVQIIAPRKVSREEAYHILLSVVDSLALSVIEVGNFIKIVDRKKALLREHTGVLSKGRVEHSDRVYTQIFPIRHVKASFLKNAMVFVANSSAMLAYDPTNSLIISETGFNLKRISGFIKALDSPQSKSYEFASVKHRFAQDLATKLKQLVSSGASKSKGSGSFEIFVGESTNTLIFVGSSAEIASARKYLETLDIPPSEDISPSTDMFIYPLSFADAKKLSSLLNSLKVESQSSSKGKLQDSLTITPDEFTNSLLVKGNPSTFRSLKSIIRRLDEFKSQIFLDCEIVSLSEENTFQFAPSIFAGGGQQNGDGTKVILGYEASPMTPITKAQIIPNDGIENVKGVTDAFAKDMTVGVFPGTKVHIPGIGNISPGALIRMMKSDSYGKTLSSPKILTLDNEEAEFLVGEKLLYTSSEADSFGNISQSVQKEDVDLSLKIKPSLGVGSYLKVELTLETKSVKNFTQEGIPQIAKQKVKQVVDLKNRQTILISGISNIGRSVFHKKVPFIGDIPVLGFLFNTRDIRNETTYTYIFVTPHILRGAEDLESLYQERYQDWNQKRSKRLSTIGIEGF